MCEALICLIHGISLGTVWAALDQFGRSLGTFFFFFVRPWQGQASSARCFWAIVWPSCALWGCFWRRKLVWAQAEIRAQTSLGPHKVMQISHNLAQTRYVYTRVSR